MNSRRTPLPPEVKPIGLAIISLFWIWGFGIETVWRMLQTDVSGTVIASQDVHPARASARFSTEYVIRNSDGREQYYIAGPTDGSLARHMPVGTTLVKRRWDLDYERDGKRVSFPILPYDVVLGIALSTLLWSILLWREQKKENGVTPQSL